MNDSTSNRQGLYKSVNEALKKNNNNNVRPLHVVFIHLDLGIGGAEQLILQLAHASHDDLKHQVDLVTTRCDANHCFASVAPDGGSLHHCLHVWGEWIPHDLFGKGRALFSTLRLLYLAYRVARKTCPDLIVLDVLPTPLPLLQLSDSALLFYCHFPDQLLLQQQNDTELPRRIYRRLMNWLEDMTMQSADTIVVNSKFTQETVLKTFKGLEQQFTDLPVLYPALDTSSIDKTTDTKPKKEYRLVSLNRFERKKNLGLLLEAVAWIREQYPELKLPQVVIAGGYDSRNVENVEYRAELGQLADKLALQVDFQQSISDAQRADLLQSSLAVVYTPAGEHFGIVPLEAMYAETPVVAVQSGGPKETILDGTTGYLCQDNTPAGFGAALVKLLQDPERAHEMGRAGRKHVIQRFGRDRLVREWQQLTESTVIKGRQRLQRRQQYRLARNLIYLMEALGAWIVCAMLMWIYRMLVGY